MKDRSSKLLWDARRAALLATEFLGGQALDACLGNALVRSAVERQPGIIGDALSGFAAAIRRSPGTYRASTGSPARGTS